MELVIEYLWAGMRNKIFKNDWILEIFWRMRWQSVDGLDKACKQKRRTKYDYQLFSQSKKDGVAINRGGETQVEERFEKKIRTQICV